MWGLACGWSTAGRQGLFCIGAFMGVSIAAVIVATMVVQLHALALPSQLWSVNLEACVASYRFHFLTMYNLGFTHSEPLG